MKKLEVVQMSDISVPQIVEVQHEGFVLNGENNSYFRMLIDLYTASPTNNAVINEISRLIYGKGLTVEKELQKKEAQKKQQFGGWFGFGGKQEQEEPEQETEVNEEALNKINELIKPKDLKRIITDRVILGNAAIQIIYKGIGNRKTIAEIKHFPVQTLASGKLQRDATGKVAVKAYYHHPKWEDYKKGDKLTKLPAYGYGTNEEIYICKPYCPNMFYWSPVDYSGSLDYCKLEEMIACHLVNTVDNNFSATTIVNINKDASSDEEMEEFSEHVNNTVTGINGKKVITSFNQGDESGITVQQLTIDQASKQFEYLSKEASRKILTGHRVTNPKLLGVPSEGEQGLGNNANEIEVAFDLFHNTVIEPFQEEILDSLKELLAINKIDEDIKFERLEPLNDDLKAKSWQTNGLKMFDQEEFGKAKDMNGKNEDNAGY